MRSYRRTVPAPVAPAALGLETIAVPAGEPIELDVRLESVTEGVYVSGSVHAPLTGECARCLDALTDEIDVEQTVRDAVVLALPLAPLCTPDCLGLCPDCGEKRADLAPDHGHETLDPRWAALRERLSAD